LRQKAISVISPFPVFEPRGHKGRPAFLGAVQDDRKRDGSDVVAKGPEMKFVRVADVFEDDSGGVDRGRILFRSCRSSGRFWLGLRHIKKKHTNYAESRDQYRFEASDGHKFLEICCKDRGGGSDYEKEIKKYGPGPTPPAPRSRRLPLRARRFAELHFV